MAIVFKHFLLWISVSPCFWWRYLFLDISIVLDASERDLCFGSNLCATCGKHFFGSHTNVGSSQCVWVLFCVYKNMSGSRMLVPSPAFMMALLALLLRMGCVVSFPELVLILWEQETVRQTTVSHTKGAAQAPERARQQAITQGDPVDGWTYGVLLMCEVIPQEASWLRTRTFGAE